mmetsp:Transcript_48183/g.139616  ORF Transcript_48183/g.139616 Transcript_48183/m.139616 type:complete len:234 (-) Transcript_48183:139-840(-)
MASTRFTGTFCPGGRPGMCTPTKPGSSSGMQGASDSVTLGPASRLPLLLARLLPQLLRLDVVWPGAPATGSISNVEVGGTSGSGSGGGLGFGRSTSGVPGRGVMQAAAPLPSLLPSEPRPPSRNSSASCRALCSHCSSLQPWPVLSLGCVAATTLGAGERASLAATSRASVTAELCFRAATEALVEAAATVEARRLASKRLSTAPSMSCPTPPVSRRTGGSSESGGSGASARP